MDAKVPQRIDMEDKVIGPLTLPQFMYLLLGGIVIYILNSWLPAGSVVRIFFYILAVPIALLSIALAFVKVQERPFISFLSSAIRYVLVPRRRVWQKGQYNKHQVIVAKPVEKAPEAPKKAFDSQRAADAAKILDTNNNG